ncbi:MAG: TRAP transporter substrate-binding protein DctP [Dehalococcoidia bacterium]|nr:TRAP transporter substrate-binding protein DctP [Dehalococcoidia bacterium]
MTRKPVLWLAVVMTVALLAVSGCSPAGTTAPEEGDGTPAAPAEEVIEWVGQSHAGGITMQHASLKRVGERIEDLSNGRLKMVVEVGGGIAPATKEWAAVDGGTLDFAVTCWMFLRDRNPSCGLFTMVSGGMSPMETLAWMNYGGGFDFAQEMLDSTDLDVHAVENGGWMGPPEIFVSTNEPLTKAGDFDGMKIRGAGDAAEIWSTLGASMVFIPPNEVYESMERGVIDGYEVSMPTLDWEFGLNEAAKYIYLSPARQPYEYNPFIVNGKRWAELPDDLKAIVVEVNQAETIRAYTELLSADMVTLQKYRDFGTNVEELPQALVDEYAAAARVYYDEKAASDEFNGRVLESYWNFQKAVQEIWGRV